MIMYTVDIVAKTVQLANFMSVLALQEVHKDYRRFQVGCPKNLGCKTWDA